MKTLLCIIISRLLVQLSFPMCEQVKKTHAKVDPAPAKPQNEVFESSHYGQCRAEYYTEKSYIRSRDASGKWRLIIGHSTRKHWQIIKALIPHVRDGKTKEQLVEKRTKLVAAV